MVERQDIDALLIGSLYGELSSTEEARLTAHLESHPADRTALANLSRAREVVRESRILQVQFDPPQSVSALLMQEAHRRAPKPREEQGWFQRFMRSFIAHPAMAAAAMLVLIIGVAGTVYMKKGDHFAKQTADEPAPQLAGARGDDTAKSTEQAPTPPTAANGQAIAQDKLEYASKDQGASGSGSAAQATPTDDFKVQLRDDSLAKEANDKVVGKADATDRARNIESTTTLSDGRPVTAKKRSADSGFEMQKGKGGEKLDLDANSDPPKAEPAKTAKATPKPAAKTPPRLEVSTPSQAPKEFGTVASNNQPNRKGDASGAGAAPETQTRPGNVSPPPPPPPQAPTTVAEEKEKADKANDPILAWAKERHGKVIAAVKANNCTLAANIAVEIANRAPSYYASNVENDRAIKNCVSYIAQQREKEAERTQRAKATQRRATDEAPAPAPKESTK